MPLVEPMLLCPAGRDDQINTQMAYYETAETKNKKFSWKFEEKEIVSEAEKVNSENTLLFKCLVYVDLFYCFKKLFSKDALN